MVLSMLGRLALCLGLLFWAAAPAAAKPAKKPPAEPAAAAADSGPAPVVLGGRIALPHDVPPPPVLADVSSYVLMDFATGSQIAVKAPDLHRPPASLTKLMTAYLTYKALADGRLKMGQSVPVSVAAWKTGGSRMFIEPKVPVTVDQLIHGLMIDSGNDAAVALAEAVAGTPSAFVAMMNSAAAQLHLADTHYSDVDGLPNPGLYTSARDVALLSRAIIREYPSILKIAGQKYFTYNKIKQRNWNPVVFRDPSVDGLKTGLTDESGHCIDATAQRGGRRLIAVVMGGPSWKKSAEDVEALLGYGYRFFANRQVATAGQRLGAIRNPLLDPRVVPVGAARTLVLTLPASKRIAPQTILTLRAGLDGPIAKGETVGAVSIALDGQAIASVPAMALRPAAPAGFAQRLIYHLKHLW